MFLEKDIKVKDPLNLFKIWLNEACETPEILEPNAFCLSTVSKYIFSWQFIWFKNTLIDSSDVIFQLPEREYRQHDSFLWRDARKMDSHFSQTTAAGKPKTWWIHSFCSSTWNRNDFWFAYIRNLIQTLQPHSIGCRCVDKCVLKVPSRKSVTRNPKNISIRDPELVRYWKMTNIRIQFMFRSQTSFIRQTAFVCRFECVWLVIVSNHISKNVCVWKR